MFRKLVAYVIAVTLTWSTWPMTAALPQQASLDQPAGQEDIEGLDRYIEVTETLRSRIDRSQFELEALTDRLDWDTEAIVRFVRQEIEFEQYPGLLRGPRGTLFSRAGNSLDQAALLAKLLKDVGFDARIARGRLMSEQARTLLAQMPPRRADAPDAVDPEQWQRLAAQSQDDELIRALDGVPPSATEIDLAVETAGLLEKTLEDHGARNRDLSDELIQEARDYFWVEYRDSAAGGWVVEQPVFSDPQSAFQGLEAAEHLEDTVPEALQHQVRLAVFVERAELGSLKTHQVVPDWQRPAANLIGRSFWIFNYPNGFDDDLFELDLEEAIGESELFTPLFNGEVLPGTSGFDLDGVPYDLTAEGMDTFGATPIFRTVGDKADEAVAALQGLGKQEETPDRARYLTAQWIDYTLIAPGGQEHTFRRYLFDRIGPAARDSGDLSGFSFERAKPWLPFSAEELTVATGDQPRGLALDEMLNDRIALAQLRRGYLESGELTSESFDRLTTESRGSGAATLFALLQSLDADLQDHTRAATYRSAPTVVSLHWHLPAEDRMTVSTDMVGNQHRSRDWQDSQSARNDLRLRGVWETIAERRAFAMLGLPVEDAQTPFTMVEDARPDPDRLVVISPGDKSRLALSGVPADQQVLIGAQLEKGYSVALLPDQPRDRLAWWRIDPHSGTVTGFLPNGRGATATEYAVVGLVVAIVIIGAVKRYGYMVGNLFDCAGKVLIGKVRFGEAQNLAEDEKPGFGDCVMQE